MLNLVVQFWTNFLFPSFFGIGEGPSPQEEQQYGAIGGVGNFATSTGEADISKASDFWQAIISGDPCQMSRVLGPAYSNISKRGGQELKTLSEFSTRSGGTAAAQQQVGESMRSEAGALEGGLLGTAASNLGGLGSGLLSTGLSAHEAAFSAAKTIQEQKEAKWNDIFKSIMDVASAFVPGGEGFNVAKSIFKGATPATASAGGGPNDTGF
jgi:hypothetical protein